MIAVIRQWHRGLLAVTLAGLFLARAAVAGGIAPGAAWDWQLQPPLDLDVPVAVLGLDPDAVSAADIAALRARGVATICYVSVGTWEDWRADAGAFPPGLIGKPYAGWPGERFLDIRAPALVDLMAARFRRCAEMGFDAIEPDNIDLHINDTGFAITGADVVAYVRALAARAGKLGLPIGQKNAPDLTAALEPVAGFAMAENCFADGWCAELAPYAAAGKAILAAEYGRNDAAVCQRARAMGISLVFKRRDLTSWRRACP